MYAIKLNHLMHKDSCMLNISPENFHVGEEDGLNKLFKL